MPTPPRTLLPRHLTTRIQHMLGVSRVVHLTGPRQSGKSTLVRMLMGDRRTFSLDDDALRSALQADPWGHLQALLAERRGDEGPLVLDEIQRVPAVTLAIKRIVDEHQAPGQFLLTGSADILTTGVASDSLAGRSSTLRLLPFSAAELAGGDPSPLLCAGDWEEGTTPAPWSDVEPVERRQVIDLILRGGYPDIRHLDEQDRMDRHHDYLDSVVERDLAAVHPIRKPNAVRRLVDQLAARTAQELNIAELCRTVGVARPSIEPWLDAIERLGITQRLGAWTSSHARREVKAPKIHFLDSGCAASLRGEGVEDLLLGGDPRSFGALLETWVFTEVVKLLAVARRRWRPWHWRTPHREVDLLLEAPGRRLLLLEVKASSRVNTEDARHLHWFATEGPGRGYRCTGIVLYLGDHLTRLGPRLFAVPISIFWSGKPTTPT